MGDKRAQVRDDYNIAMSGPRQSWLTALTAAAPTDRSYSEQFGRDYLNLNREQAGQQAAQQYKSALSPQFMRTAAGRAQAARVLAQTVGRVAQIESSNRMNLETAKLNLGQQNWANKVAYAGLQGQNVGLAAQQAGANANIAEAGIGAQEARQQNWQNLGINVAGQLLGPTVTGIGTAIARGAGVGLPTNPKYLAAGGDTRSDAITGDGGSAPELILNPTSAPLTVVPMTNKRTPRMIPVSDFMPMPPPMPKSPYMRLPRYAAGGVTRSVMFVTGDGRTGGY